MSVAVQLDMAGIGTHQAGQDVEAGGLAGAVGAEQADGFAALERQRDAAQHGTLAELLDQVAHHQAAILGFSRIGVVRRHHRLGFRGFAGDVVQRRITV
jgi:hypothetical protein